MNDRVNQNFDSAVDARSILHLSIGSIYRLKQLNTAEFEFLRRYFVSRILVRTTLEPLILVQSRRRRALSASLAMHR